MRVRIEGYVLPIDREDDLVYEFMLVPWFDACSHAPQPAANQMVHVIPEAPIRIERSFDFVSVTGSLRPGLESGSATALPASRSRPRSTVWTMPNFSSSGCANTIATSPPACPLRSKHILPAKGTSPMRTESYSCPNEASTTVDASDEVLDAAYARGFEMGASAERDRLCAALGAPGINGCSWRMLAVLELAVEEPAMPASALAAMVIANVAGQVGCGQHDSGNFR